MLLFTSFYHLNITLVDVVILSGFYLFIYLFK
jgi:hypothetical protein